MALKTSLTGSYPPLAAAAQAHQDSAEEAPDLLIQQGIRRAVEDQKELGVDFLVDGQIREDIISLFANRLGGFVPHSTPFRIKDRVTCAAEPITVRDYVYARLNAGSQPLKAHITGPITLARASRIAPENSAYGDRNDRRLVMDLAEALAREAEALVDAGAEVVQIDEPALADGVDMNTAFEAIGLIVERARIPFPALHVCGNVTYILKELLQNCPVRMVSIEGAFLNHKNLQSIDAAFLSGAGKQIGLGCIQVVDLRIDRQRAVQDFLDAMVMRLGEENIWAAMTNCGLRTLPHAVAREKVRVLVDAARALDSSGFAPRKED